MQKEIEIKREFFLQKVKQGSSNMADFRAKFEKLNNSNYSNWKYKMELLLKKEGLWSTINKTAPSAPAANATAEITAAYEKNLEKWERNNEEAISTIGLSVEDSQIVHIRNEATALGVWTKLKSYHEKDSLDNKIYLMRKICMSKMTEGGDAPAHINAMIELFTKLQDISETDALSEGWQVTLLLTSLPESYGTLVTMMNTITSEERTLASVQQKIICEYDRRLHQSGGVKAEQVMRAVDNGIACFFCKNNGHMKRDCAEYKKWKAKQAGKGKDKVNSAQQEDRQNDFLFNIGSGEFGWLLDSGATRHVVNNKSFFTTLDESYKSVIEVASGEKVCVSGIGSGKLRFLSNNGTVNQALVRDVLFAPKMKGNILSVSKLTDNGFDVVFKRSVCEIGRNGKQIAIADRRGNLYELRVPSKVNAVTHGHSDNCIHTLHRVFGHRDPDAIRKMASKQFIEGMKIVECGIKETCETCVKAKMTRMPFPKESSSKTDEILDLIHTDVCGPMQTATPGGKRYIITIIDDYSRFTVIKLLSHKSEAESAIRQFVEFTKTKFGRKPKLMRSDRGGEYTGNQLKEYLSNEGIQTQLTAPYTPQQNGVAERKNRSIMEMARCMLTDAGLPKTFWGEAVSMAVYVQNRTITRATEAIPFEQWNGTKVSLDDFRTFGCKCFVHVPTEKRKKLDQTAIQMIFFGYDDQTKGYRCYNPDTNGVTISRDVKFSNGFQSSGRVVKTDDGCQVNKQDPVERPGTINIDLTSSRKCREETQAAIQEEIDEDIEPEDEHEEIGEDITIQEENGGNGENHGEGEEEDFELADGMNQDDIFETPLNRISTRATKGRRPRRLIEEISVVTDVEEPRSYNEAISCGKKDEWIGAMRDEMNSLNRNGTWELTDLPGDRKAIGCKWVFKVKTNADGGVQRYKARLVAQGYSQKFGTDYNDIFAPVVRQATFRTLLAVAAKDELLVEHLDAKTAFLNGSLTETIFMKQPPGFIEGDSSRVCLLRKSIYGLKQAARAWNEAIHNVLANEEFTQSKVDQCLYSKQIDGDWCYILIYVDDVIVACKSVKQSTEIENILSSKFEMQNLGNVKQYLGIEITRNADGIFELCQAKYIDQIVSSFGLKDAKGVNTPLDVGYYASSSAFSTKLLDNSDYQKLIGCLLYISVNTRPDIAASVSILAQCVSGPSSNDWNQLKRVARYLKATSKMKLTLGRVDAAIGELVGYADANWAEDRSSRKSNSGYAFFYNNGLIDWSCRKQNCVSLSSTEAEFVSLSDACQEAAWLQRLLLDFHQRVNLPITIFEDNQSCLKIAKDERFSNRTKHIDTKYHFVKDYIQRKLVKCEYCPTDEMIADLFTKPLAKPKHDKFRSLCNLK